MSYDVGDCQKDLADCLRSEFETRKTRNEAYSLRAFARDLQISSGVLSELLAGKRTLTPKAGKKIFSRLTLPPESALQVERLLASNEPKKPRFQLIGAKAKRLGFVSQPRVLNSDYLEAMAAWEHYAVINLMETHNFTPVPEWIAERLGIAVEKVRGALERLTRLGIIESKDGRLTLNRQNMTTSQDIPSDVIRGMHHDKLRQASEALEAVPVGQRDYSFISMAVDPEKLPHVKKLISDFRRQIAAYLEDGQRSEVFALNVQFFPLTKMRRPESPLLP